tara:strand:- start:794 stop:1030 length:237 start_codon:yes stop_codon:yes gene_type:complete
LAEYRIVYPVVAGSNPVGLAMVAVAQLVERRVVVSVVEGSIPFGHPKCLVSLTLGLAGRPPLDVTPLTATTYNYFGFL